MRLTLRPAVARPTPSNQRAGGRRRTIGPPEPPGLPVAQPRPIEPLAPDKIAGLGIDELRGNPDAFPHPADAALDEEANAQLTPNPLHVDGLALEAEG